MSLRLRVVLSASFAMLGVLACLAYADSVRREAERVRSDAIARFGGEVAQLVVATQGLETGDVVTERNVSVRDWVSDLAPQGAITDLSEVMGREVSMPVAAGSPLTELSFRDERALSDVPSGHVALSVPVTDKLWIARGVGRGAHVCAYAVSSDVAPRLISADMEVLSEMATTTGIGATQQITIAVLPRDVAAVLGASATGDLRLVIPADDIRMSEEGASGEGGVQESLPPEESSPDEEGAGGTTDGEGEQQ